MQKSEADSVAASGAERRRAGRAPTMRRVEALLTALRRELGRRRGWLDDGSLLGRLVAANAVVLVAAGLALALSPLTVSSPIALSEAVVLVGGLTAMLLVTLFLMRRVVAPLEDLAALMRRIDPLRPGRRIAVHGGGREVRELAEAFNAMLDRLESERRESARSALAAQEAERLRIGRELHDEIGQLMTAILLQLEQAARRAPDDVRPLVVGAQGAAEAGLEEVGDIARRLRPEALDDLGLTSALATLSNRIAARAGFRVERRFDAGLPALTREAELVLYRIAQEALTNASRHAGASRVQLRLEAAAGGLRLRVRDDGRGLGGAEEGTGVRGMRERAMLIGASLAIEESSEGGVEVRLDVPAEQVAA